MTASVDINTSSFGADVGIKAGGAATETADAPIREAWAMSEAGNNFEGSATAILNESAAMVQKAATT